MKTRNKITENSKLKDILEIKGAEEILAKYMVPCLSCPMAYLELEKLEIGVVGKMYGLETKKILDELNKKHE
ncbi:MAG: hypothetical protein AAB529_02115 [Patescibacteria group bacterium]